MPWLVTRGFGTGASQVLVQGFNPTPSAIVETIERPLRLRTVGQSGTKRRLYQELEPVIVWAKLIEANGVVPPNPIVGNAKVAMDQPPRPATVKVEHVSSRRREVWERIKISVRRLGR